MLKFSSTIFLLFVALASYGQEQSSIADTLGTNIPTTKSIDSLSSKELNKMDSATNRITSKIDSLQAKGLPTTFYQKKLDSINSKLRSHLALRQASEKINGKVSSLKSKLNSPRDSIQKAVDLKASALQKRVSKKKSSVDSISAKIKDPSINLPTTTKLDPKLPASNLPNQSLPNTSLPNSSVNVPGVNLPNETSELNKLSKSLALPQTQELKQVGNELGTLPKKELETTGITKEVSEIKKDAKELGALEKQAKEYKSDIKKIKEGDSAKIASLSQDAKKVAMERTEFKELQKEEKIVQTQKNALQQYQDMLGNVNKETGLKEAQKISSKELPNYFEGQEEKLKAGIAQLDKLKKKYHTIPDSRYLPKRVPNEMKGKPLLERLVTGVSYQIYQKSKTGLDISPYLMYRLTGRLRVGLGVSERLIIDSKEPYISNGKIQALRIMADFKIISSFHFHIEAEWTHYNQDTQNLFRSPNDPPMKDWSTKLNVGVLKTYKISRRLDGQAQIMYNVIDWSTFPQNKNTALRFGIEYRLGVKKANQSKAIH